MSHNLAAISSHLFHYNLQTLQYRALMGYNLFAEIERLLRNRRADLPFGGYEYVPERLHNEARSHRRRLNVKLRWLNGNIDTLVHGYINIVICNWCNLMDCVSVGGFVGAVLSISKVLIMICDGWSVCGPGGEEIREEKEPYWFIRANLINCKTLMLQVVVYSAARGTRHVIFLLLWH